MNVPTICAINQATLALYATRRTSGIIVNIGFHQTSVVPILHELDGSRSHEFHPRIQEEIAVNIRKLPSSGCFLL
ncbi:unnamed protein product [Camellia sinensis]